MPRLKLKRHPEYQFKHTINVRVSDLNYGAHLANDRLVSIIHQIRVELFHELGFTELNLGDGATGILMSDLQVLYKSEAFLHEELVVQTLFTEIKKSSTSEYQKGGTLY